jgi:hypothetical protein
LAGAGDGFHWINLKKGMIVKTKKIKDESKKKNRRSLPPARIGAAPLRLIRGAASVEAAHHAVLGCALFGKEKS